MTIPSNLHLEQWDNSQKDIYRTMPADDNGWKLPAIVQRRTLLLDGPNLQWTRNLSIVRNDQPRPNLTYTIMTSSTIAGRRL